jgi:hypothetical protein
MISPSMTSELRVLLLYSKSAIDQAGALGISYGQMTVMQLRRGALSWVEDDTAAIVGITTLLIIVGTLVVIVIVGMATLFTMLLLLVSQFVAVVRWVCTNSGRSSTLARKRGGKTEIEPLSRRRDVWWW